jgi:RES domain
MLDIWQECQGDQHIQTFQCKAWRIIENQNRTATRKLVDSLKEQEILEEIIEFEKPALPELCQGYHYLLFTAFRYPPLKKGSRFGTRYEPSLWYGSYNIETALAEKAYYRLLLLRDSDAIFDELPITYTAFQAEIETNKGVDLTKTPFSQFKHEISKKDSYIYSQSLGSKMRSANIPAFSFKSARCPKEGINMGLFVPQGFKAKKPLEPFQTWQGTVTNSKSHMEFVRTNGLHMEIQQFTIDIFMVDGKLPNPAA